MDWWKKNKSQANVPKELRRVVRERKRGEILLEELIKCCDGKSNPIKFFSADQIIKATDTVCKCTRVSELSDHARWYSGMLDICQCTRVSELSDHVRWYSGMLDNNRTTLVKESMLGDQDDHTDFCRDVAISSMVSGHNNFMKLVGCCLESIYPVMVYYGAKKQYSRIDLEIVVSWRRRLKIAEDIATALAYLHTAFPRPFVYRTMDLHNILLDEDGVAKLSDFSNCVSIPKGETYVHDIRVVGEIDYMDDDYLIYGVVSEKTDVYGFGIFMQKLLTGEHKFRELYPWKDLNDWTSFEKRFPNWLSKSIGEGRMGEILDPKMLEKMAQVSEEERCRMEAFIVLSEKCIGLRGEVPKMVQVAKELRRLLLKDSSSTKTQIDSSSGPSPKLDLNANPSA